MRPLILICNDDGINSPFLPKFAEEIGKIGDAVVVVPSGEQSWIGHAHNRHGEIRVDTLPDICGIPCFSVSGTPADCANIAISHLCKRRPDAVASGLNIGHNLGFPILWSSGTFAAAMESAGFGIPSGAFSLRISKEFYEACRTRHLEVPKEIRPVLSSACKHAADFVANKLIGENPICPDGKIRVFNVNYPDNFSESTHVERTTPARMELSPLFKNEGKGLFTFSYSAGRVLDPSVKNSDWECVYSGKASVSEIII